MMKKNRRQAGVTMLEVIIAGILLTGVFIVTFMVLFSSTDAAAAGQIQVQLERQAVEVLNQISQDLRGSMLTQVTFGDGSGAVSTGTSGGPQDTSLDSPGPFYPNTPPLPMTYHPGSPTNTWMSYPYSDMQIRLMPTKDAPGWTVANYEANELQYWTRRVRYQLVMDPGSGEDGSPPGSIIRPNNIDENKNLLFDEQAIKKVETELDSTGNPVASTPAKPNPVTSIICRDVQKNGLQIRFVATGQNANKIRISLTLEKKDPRDPKRPNITKTVETYVSVRN